LLLLSGLGGCQILAVRNRIGLVRRFSYTTSPICYISPPFGGDNINYFFFTTTAFLGFSPYEKFPDSRRLRVPTEVASVNPP
jgi:hypothetical protein